MHVDGRAGRGLLRAGRRAVAPVRRLRARATSPTSATTPTRCSRSPATSSACATRCPSSRDGSYRTLPAPNDDVWAWLRGERTVVACNLSDAPVDVADVGPGAIRISTDPRARRRAGRRVAAPRAVGSRDRLARRLSAADPDEPQHARRGRARPRRRRPRTARQDVRRDPDVGRAPSCDGVSPTISARSASTPSASSARVNISASGFWQPCSNESTYASTYSSSSWRRKWSRMS